MVERVKRKSDRNLWAIRIVWLTDQRILHVYFWMSQVKVKDFVFAGCEERFKKINIVLVIICD